MLAMRKDLHPSLLSFRRDNQELKRRQEVTGFLFPSQFGRFVKSDVEVFMPAVDFVMNSVLGSITALRSVKIGQQAPCL